jgi:hypothetical protein
MKKAIKVRTITIVIAPGIPQEELEKLKKRWLTNAIVVANYEIVVEEFQVLSSEKLIVCADGIPRAEVKALNRKLKQQDLIFVNYAVTVMVR